MRRHHLLSLAGLTVIAIAACAPREKASEGFGDDIERYVPRIEKAVGVKFKTPPRVETRSREQVREFLLLKLKEPNVQKQFSEAEATFKVLGLIPDTMHLPGFYVKVLTEQIMGYYDPKTKTLYMIEGAPEEYAAITLMHELVHALQDQYVNLDSLQNITGDDDRAAAAQAVIEGQATYEQIYIMAGGSGNIAAQLPGGMESMREAIRKAQESQPVFSSAPRVIREGLLFPYINGFDFIRRFSDRRPKQLPFDSMPVSTEQLMHDDAYFGKTRDEPSVVTLPSLSNVIAENNFGEFGTRLFIFSHTREQDRSIRAAMGWDGDRYAVVKTPAGNAIAWVTVWDSPADAAEFVSAIDTVVAQRFFVQPRISGVKRRYESSRRTIEVDVRDIDKRTAVLYLEAPSGALPAFDFSRVKVIAK